MGFLPCYYAFNGSTALRHPLISSFSSRDRGLDLLGVTYLRRIFECSIFPDRAFKRPRNIMENSLSTHWLTLSCPQSACPTAQLSDKTTVKSIIPVPIPLPWPYRKPSNPNPNLKPFQCRHPGHAFQDPSIQTSETPPQKSTPQPICTFSFLSPYAQSSLFPPPDNTYLKSS